ncbi:MAG: polyprenyl synthetase family protein, partial [Chloroflexota bacterium]|nr:polyprenyl synthetase family protein [Chloroflexota bacterium]
MWHEEQAKLLRFEIESHLFNAIEQEHLRELVKIPLTTARRALSHECDSSWPLLPLMVCEGICGRYQHALPAAAALQLLLAAGDVFDDIEDEDSPGSLPAKYGQAIATNAATALIILAEKALAHLVNEETTRQAGICILQKVNEFYTTACIGQHLDLPSNECPPISEDRYFHIAAMKSAS